MLDRFCGAFRDEIVSRIAHIRWKNSAAQYVAEFASALCRGEPLPQDQLVTIFLANLPDDIVMRMTNAGHANCTMREAAAAELRKTLGSWDETLNQLRQARHYLQQTLQQSRGGAPRLPRKVPFVKRLSVVQGTMYTRNHSQEAKVICELQSPMQRSRSWLAHLHCGIPYRKNRVLTTHSILFVSTISNLFL